MPRFVKDDKYFECISVGDTVLRGAGKIGRTPRTQSKDYDDEESVRAALAKLVARQEKAGFVHVHDRLEALSEFAVNETYCDRDIRKGTTSLQLARVALDSTANDPPDDPNAALIRSVVELMEGTSGTSDQRDDGAKAEPRGPGV